MSERRSSRSSGTTARPAAASRGRAAASPFLRGRAGRERIEVEQEKSRIRKERRAKEYGKPFRFYVPVGETKEAVVLDEEPDFFMYEHTMRDPDTGRWGKNVTCISENDTCPLCEELGPSSYVMLLSVLDLTPYTDKAGVVHEFSRKIMAVKQSQQKKFVRHLEREGSLRGAIFEFTRDGEKDAIIGNDINFLEWMEEDELAEEYIRTWVDKDKKQHSENCGEPYNYEELFEVPTYEELAELVGRAGEHAPGSRRANRKALDEEEEGKAGDGWDKNPDAKVPWEGDGEEPVRTRRGRGGVRAAEPEPEARPTRRGRGARAEPESEPDAGPARRSSRRAAAAEPEPEAPRRTRSATRGRR